MKKIYFFALSLLVLIFAGCSNDDDGVAIIPGEATGNITTYDLSSVSDPDISGTVTFTEKTDGSTDISILMDGTTGGSHPAHIHAGTALEGGDIVIDLTPVDGATRRSLTNVTATNDGTDVSYEDLINFDGYINVHASASDLGTLLAQGDIGENALTGESKEYTLFTKDVEGIEGTALFEERVSGETLITLDIQGTPEGGMHPAHIHAGTTLDNGAIVVSLTTVDGDTGMSMTDVSALNDGSPVTYEELLEFDGYINVHASANDLGTIVAQGDIGQNEILDSKEYELMAKTDANVMGTATIAMRADSTSVVTLNVENTIAGTMHPAHIHENSAVETGAIVVDLMAVNGDTGISMTNVSALNDDTEVSYEDLLEFDGYINIHLNGTDLTVVSQTDIGANELTGNTKSYVLATKDVAGINGTALFSERMDGTTLVELTLNGTPAGGMHPAHIHANTAVEGGDIEITLGTVNGTTGMSAVQVEALNGEDGTPNAGEAITYAELLDFDGYINVHLSATELGTIVAQGDIGQNELTGTSKTYVLNTKDVPGINGTAKFEERVNGETLVTLDLDGTPAGGEHPAHIHAGSVAEAPGDILITLMSVDGDTGMSQTNVTAYNAEDGTANGGAAITYDDMVAIDGYINVHLSATQLGTIVAQGNVGANAN
ncbi:CHRD domain-containing protein [Leeuwenhoekiella parthenopeia]|uniref:CHRD domain-containing protein n=1 Tax=Leeuwenhoekiella parthenopeia TaxID=2890320 RepID=A0ABS8GVA7_9FLAO|nr:CHRD domain-containing protein [Leeuwenhoekiella parthenopeia]MCC4213127.1 CHRD domain-containing protein [Leeuwenhoekiella parthenopeia]